MANNIVLKTYKGGNVTPQDDAIIHDVAIATNGIFKGCEVSHARGNVLRVSQGFGMIKGRFFEVYESEVPVQLATAGQTLNGRIYIHMDLANADEPIMLLAQTAKELPALDMDADVNYNNSSFDIQLAAFEVSSSEISNLTQTFTKILPGAGGSGGGGGNSLMRDTQYALGDTATVAAAPGWVTLVCTQAGTTALAEPTTYATIQNIGDSILDGSCVFTARNIIGELDDALAALTDMDSTVNELSDRVDEAMNSSGNLVTKIISLVDYKALETYNENCIYLCYEDANTQKITHIYLGENTIFFDGVTVTYQMDTGETESIHLDDGADVLALAPTAAKDGYDFVGWRKDTEANSKVLTSCIVETEGDFTLYAVFKRDISIGMFPNGGTLIEGKTESTLETSCYYNNGNSLSEEVVIPECPYEWKDKSFCGWACNGELYKPKQKGSFIDDSFMVPEWVDTVYDFPYTGSYVTFTIPADGIYEFEVWGAKGADAEKSTGVVGQGGLGGHAKGYKKMKKGEKIYIFNGGRPTRSTYGGENGGAPGGSYNNYGTGAGGGGATSIMYRSGVIASYSSSSSNYKTRETDILIIAGGGGGGGVTSDGITNKGGDGGGERGEDGSGTAFGGRQISTSSSEYYNFGTAQQGSTSSSNTYSGGGGGYFGGQTDYRGESGAGGSGYVGGVAAFTHNKKYYPTLNEVGVNEGDGYSFIRYVEIV